MHKNVKMDIDTNRFTSVQNTKNNLMVTLRRLKLEIRDSQNLVKRGLGGKPSLLVL